MRKLSKDNWNSDIQSALASVGTFEDFEIFESVFTESQGFTFKLDDYRFIVFPGTEQPRDFLTDVNAKLTPFGVNQYHTGMGQAFTSIEGQIRSFLSDKEKCPIVCVGHSLGGGLAQISSIEIPNVRYVFTFGAPPITCANYKTENSVECYHFINDGDSVPRSMVIGSIFSKGLIRFTNYLIGDSQKNNWWRRLLTSTQSYLTSLSPDLDKYVHFGKILLINKDCTIREIKSIKEAKDGFLQSLANNYKRTVKDHFMDEYVLRLGKLYPEGKFIEN